MHLHSKSLRLVVLFTMAWLPLAGLGASARGERQDPGRQAHLREVHASLRSAATDALQGSEHSEADLRRSPSPRGQGGAEGAEPAGSDQPAPARAAVFAGSGCGAIALGEPKHEEEQEPGVALGLCSSAESGVVHSDRARRAPRESFLHGSRSNGRGVQLVRGPPALG